MKKFAITVTPRMLSRLRLVRASRNPSRSSVIVEVRAAAGRPDVLPDGSASPAGPCCCASPARPTGTTSKIRSRRASDHRSIDSATGRAGGTRGTHISRNRPTPSMPATPRKAVPTPARSATAPPSNCPAATPDASAIVSHAIALCSRHGPTMSSSSARRLVMSTTQPMPAKSRNGNSSKMPSWSDLSAKPMMATNGTSMAVWSRTVRRRSKRSEMTPPMAPPSSSGAHMTAPVSCTIRGESVIWLTW